MSPHSGLRALGQSLLPIVVLVALLPGHAHGQDFRGGITGRVSDSSAARLPGATVTAVNTATSVSSTTTTNTEGSYTVLYLTPGIYSVVVELAGFKKVVREGIEVRVGDRLTLDFVLEVGRLEETVSVRAESPLLSLASASAGQVIDEKRIALMPLSDGNPFVLSRLVPGVAYTGDLKFSRPFDNAGTSSINADGSTGGNEFTLDGSPNMASGRRVAFVPPAGAVQEFKVQTASFDAADGHTAGAMVNVTLKSGTNALKGESYYYLRDESLSATDFFVNRSGGSKPQLDYKRFGGSLGGPVRVPGLIDGRGRTFFFGAIEWLVRPFPGAGAANGADGGDAERRFLVAARPGHHYLRSGHRAAGQRPGRPRHRFPATSSRRTASVRSPRTSCVSIRSRTSRETRPDATTTSPSTRAPTTSTRFRLASTTASRTAAAVRPLHPQRLPRIAERPVRRGRRRGPDRQLPVPEERRHHRRSRLHDQQSVAAEHPRRAGSSSANRTSGSTKGCSIPPRSASAAATLSQFGGAQLLPALRFRHAHRHR